MARFQGKTVAGAVVSAGGLLEVGDGVLVVFLGTVVTVVIGVVFVMTSEYRIDLVTYWLKIVTRRPGDPMPRRPIRRSKAKRLRRGSSGGRPAA